MVVLHFKLYRQGRTGQGRVGEEDILKCLGMKRTGIEVYVGK